MVTAITPSLTVGAITGERERKTYELLRTTLLPARKIVVGKLTAALTYMVLLILAAVPLESLAFVLGGVTVGELVIALLILLVAAFFSASVGLLFSALARSTRVASALAYATTLLTTVGIPVLLGLSSALRDNIVYDHRRRISWVAKAAMIYALYIGAGLSPVTAAILTEVIFEAENTFWFFWETVDSHHVLLPSTWLVYIVFHLILGLLLLGITVARVRRQETR